VAPRFGIFRSSGFRVLVSIEVTARRVDRASFITIAPV
jgi:hypothetical protein